MVKANVVKANLVKANIFSDLDLATPFYRCEFPPATTAYILVTRLPNTNPWKKYQSFFSITKVYFSYYYNLPSRTVIVLVASGIIVVALMFSPSQGILTNPRSNFGSSILVKDINQTT